MITTQQILAAAPNAHPDIVAGIVDHWGEVSTKWGLTTGNRALGFLSTAYEESGGFTVLSENLNYSAARACQVFPSKFPSGTSAAPYAYSPEKFADRVYGGRMGNSLPDDGWRYRGQGLIQITGHDNFAMLEKLTGLPLLQTPSMATSDDHLLECSVALFTRYPGILTYCDEGDWNAVWALVGSGRPNGPVINLANHQAALAALQCAGVGVSEAHESGYAVGSAKWAQSQLVKAGFDPKGVDGVWGRASMAALREFEIAKNLTVDEGLLGPETISALKLV